jgi:hypothetical protein
VTLAGELARQAATGVKTRQSDYVELIATATPPDYASGWYLAGIPVLAVACMAAVSGWLRPRLSARHQAGGPLVGVGVLALATGVLFPAGSYLFVWPLLFGLPAGARPGDRARCARRPLEQATAGPWPTRTATPARDDADARRDVGRHDRAPHHRGTPRLMKPSQWACALRAGSPHTDCGFRRQIDRRHRTNVSYSRTRG